MSELNQQTSTGLESPELPQRAPRLSVILATDDYPTIQPVVEQLRRQTLRKEIELVLVGPSAEALSPALRYREEFAAIQIVQAPTNLIAPLRAAGVRVAAAPIVYIGETHAYPCPDMAELLLEALAGPWAAACPAIVNANPARTLSWAGLLSDYGRWADGLPAGEIPAVPPHNSAYRKSVLLEFGDRLDRALGFGDELPIGMRSRGHRSCFEPVAQVSHMNVSVWKHWVRERFVSGFVTGANRAECWSLFRRFVYVSGSFLIPAVLLWRILPGVRATARRNRLPAGTITAIAVGFVVRAAGEMWSYAGASRHSNEQLMNEFEMHKLAYVAPGESAT